MPKEECASACVISVRFRIEIWAGHLLTHTTDVLNRFPNLEDHQQTVHIMKYIFPRQFGLHNVFTSKVDPRDTALPFKDYTLREKEIQQVLQRQSSKRGISRAKVDDMKSHVPKRLRGEPVSLVNKLRKLNKKCSYIELLRHYCPVEVEWSLLVFEAIADCCRALIYPQNRTGGRIYFNLVWMEIQMKIPCNATRKLAHQIRIIEQLSKLVSPT